MKKIQSKLEPIADVGVSIGGVLALLGQPMPTALAGLLTGIVGTVLVVIVFLQGLKGLGILKKDLV